MRQRCPCPSRKEIYSEKCRIENLSAAEDTILQIFSRHFNSHPLIPDRNGSFRAPEVIYRKVPWKCTPGAGKETTSGFGRTCLSISTAQSNGHCGSGPATLCRYQC